MDVDGVLTDGTVTLDGEGHESKSVSFADIMGVSLGRRAGLQFGLVSGEAGPTLDQIARKFGIDDVQGGCKDKAAALRSFAARYSLELEQICFIGDDVNDVPAMEICGLAAAPATAHTSVRAISVIVTARGGGHGAVREILDRLVVAAE